MVKNAYVLCMKPGRPNGAITGRHRTSDNGVPTRIYRRWQAIKADACKEWQGRAGFDMFCDQMGEAKPGTTIVRIDDSKPFSKSNCRWVTMAEFRSLGATGRRPDPSSIRQQSIVAGMPYALVYQRMRHGWSIEKALTTPKRCQT